MRRVEKRYTMDTARTAGPRARHLDRTEVDGPYPRAAARVPFLVIIFEPRFGF